MHQNSEVNGKTSPQSQKNLRYFKFDFMCFFSAQWHPKNLASNLSQLIRAVFEVCRQRFRRPQQISYKSFYLIYLVFSYQLHTLPSIGPWRTSLITTYTTFIRYMFLHYATYTATQITMHRGCSSLNRREVIGVAKATYGIHSVVGPNMTLKTCPIKEGQTYFMVP